MELLSCIGHQLQQFLCSFSAGSNKLWSFSLAGNYVTAGSTGQVLFWDRRNGKQCAAFTDIHAEDVTQVSSVLHTDEHMLCRHASGTGLVVVQYCVKLCMFMLMS